MSPLMVGTVYTRSFLFEFGFGAYPKKCFVSFFPRFQSAPLTDILLQRYTPHICVASDEDNPPVRKRFRRRAGKLKATHVAQAQGQDEDQHRLVQIKGLFFFV